MYKKMLGREDCADFPCKRIPKDLAGMLRDQLEAQSDFCSIMGSVLGNFLWDLSKCPHIACTLANKSRIAEMLEVARSAIMCYNSACQRSDEAWPAGLSPDETRLAISLAGVAANLAAVSPGVIISCGKTLLKDVIKIIPDLPAEPLKKVLFDLLYNVSLDEAGASTLQEKEVMKAIYKALSSGPDIRLSGLKLLASLTSRDMPNLLLYQVPIDKVKTLYHTGDVEMSHYANMIIKNMTPFLEDQ